MHQVLLSSYLFYQVTYWKSDDDEWLSLPVPLFGMCCCLHVDLLEPCMPGCLGLIREQRV